MSGTPRRTGASRASAAAAVRLGTRGSAGRWLLLASIAAVAFLVYANSLGGGFVWDDQRLIVDDRAVKSWDHLGEIFSHDFFDRREDDLPYGYYRPLCTVSYLVDFQLWGLTPFGYHLTNVALHAVCSVLVGWILLRLGWGQLAAAVAALLFAVHPMHTENVAWVAGRTDLLAFFFCALSLLLYQTARPLPESAAGKTGRRRRVRAAEPPQRQRPLLALSVLSFALGLLAKEMSVVLVAWIALVHLIAHGDGRRAALRFVLPYLAVVAAYAVWRFAILDIPPPGVPAEHNLGAVVLSAAPTIVRYLGWLLLPFAQSAYVQNPYVTSLSDPRLWISAAILGALSIVSRRFARGSTRAGLAGAMLLASFVPILNFARVAGPADMGNAMAERFLYFPSFPFAALVGLGVSAAVEKTAPRSSARRALFAALAAVLALAGAATLSRNRVWKDESTFLLVTLRDQPGASLLWGNLANHHLREGNLDEAARAIEQATALDPESYSVLASRALWHVMSGRPSEAIPLQEKIAANARKGRVAALNNLAFLYRNNGRAEEAREILQRLVREGHGYADVQFNLAEIHREEGQVEAARSEYRKALDDRPHDLGIATALADLEIANGRPEEAEAIYRRMLRSFPRDARLLNNVALTLHQRGDQAGALDLLRRVLEIQPDYVRARINYAELLESAGRSSDALAEMESAARLADGTDLEKVARERLQAMRDAKHPEGAPVQRQAP